MVLAKLKDLFFYTQQKLKRGYSPEHFINSKGCQGRKRDDGQVFHGDVGVQFNDEEPDNCGDQ